MTSTRSFSVFTIVFAAAYAVVYLISVANNFALFTYYPATNEIAAGVQPAKGGAPAMYWYGWITTSAIAASAISVCACFLPERITQRLWSGWSWLVPVCTIPVFCYLLKNYFLR